MKLRFIICLTFIIGVTTTMVGQISPLQTHSNTDWHLIDSLLEIGLEKSARAEINNAYQSSKTFLNHADFIKALVYKIRLNQHNANPNEFISELESEILITETPQSQILHSFLGDFYMQYYRMNRWKINQRTPLKHTQSTDILNWDKTAFFEYSRNHYLASLQHPDSLCSISIEAFNDILIEDSLSSEYFPTLYDLLAQRAIQYFERNSGAVKSTNRILAEHNFFASTDAFLTQDIQIINADNYLLQAIKIYQSLSQLHHHHLAIIALSRTELMRLQFVKNKFYFKKLNDKYIVALSELANSVENHVVYAEIYYEIARIYANAGSTYDPFNKPQYQWEKLKAIEICEKVLTEFPESIGGKACQNLLTQIQYPAINLELKSENLPNEPILASLTYKNINKLNFRLIQLSFLEEQKINSELRGKGKIKYYLKKDPSKEWSQRLPNEGDYQSHNIQLRIPELDIGYYVLLASPDPEFHEDSLIHTNEFWVTELSFILRNDVYGSMDLFVLNRKTGLPFSGAELIIQTGKYNYKLRKTEWENSKSVTTPKSGYLRLDDLSKYNSHRFIFSNAKDSLVENRVYSRGKIDASAKEGISKTRFFTDRSIYRPGQTVYFKGIVYQKVDDNFNVVRSLQTEISFIDANQQQISSATFTTNKFGSFYGSFIIPKGALNGEMHIKNKSGSVWISVEEYKRPNFEIKFDSIKSQYRLNDDVLFTGTANTFSGSPLVGAQGKYTITRSYNPIYLGNQPLIFSEDEQISFGEFQVNDVGEFEIQFKALPDDQITKEQHPVFSYKIKAEVTDLNGETQQAETSIRLAYTDLKLLTNLSDAIDKEGSGFIELSASNTNGIMQEVNVSISIFKLEVPKKIFKKRNWQRPDYFTTDQESFYTYFPNDQFDNEAEVGIWKIDHQVYQAEINTGEVKGLQLDELKTWTSGKYKITFKARDDFDEEVEIHHYFTLYAGSIPQMPIPKIEFFMLAQDNIIVGDTLRFIIGSSKKNIRILYELQHKNKVILNKWIRLRNEKQKIEIPLSKAIKGVLNLNLLFVIDNEIYSRNETIKILDPSRKLNIKLETFRPIIKPGSDEIWKINISGSKEELVETELMATMMDASLDKLKPHYWDFSLPDNIYNAISWNTSYSFEIALRRSFNQRYSLIYFSSGTYAPLRYKWAINMIDIVENDFSMQPMDNTVSATAVRERSSMTMKSAQIPEPVQIRKNFNETAFFYPDLKTDKLGNISLKFTSPESLTRWKFMALAHTKDLRVAQITENIITQKELMVSPNIPRFFREGDTIFFNTKVINISNKAINGEVSLEIVEAQNKKPIKGMILDKAIKAFEIAKNSSINKQWKLSIPSGVDAVVYRLIVSSKNHNDGEERLIPVLPNKILVTESIPIHLNPNEEKEIKFERLINSANDSELLHHRLKLEMTSNPAWYAIQALPSIAAPSREDAISLFNKIYAHSMAYHLLHSRPEIKDVFNNWKTTDTDAFLSQLEKNQELKSVLLEETPWLLDAKNDTENKRRLAQFFDINTIDHQLNSSIAKLIKLQLPDGSWSWFRDMRGSRYITQHIVLGLVRLQSKNALASNSNKEISIALKKAIEFLTWEFTNDYKQLKQIKNVNLELEHLSNLQIQLLFIFSQFNESGKDMDEFQTARDYFLSQVQKYWPERTNYLQAMIAMTLFRSGDDETANLILKSLQERAEVDDELGMYWNSSSNYFWYQAPIETQAMIIEAFHEIKNDQSILIPLKKWLLKQKQTQLWATPKASVEAVNALLLGDSEMLKNTKPIEVKLGNEKVDIEGLEAGTTYYESIWSGGEIKADMGRIWVKNENNNIAWGALHWQYFSALDKISSSETSLKIEKQLFIKEAGENSPTLITIDEERKLQIGDRLVSRMIVIIDRDMEYIHLKDMHASAFEPIDVISGYHYKNGIGFYKSITDAATHYYFERLRAGTYVFENEMFVSQIGEFSNGITTIQCLYAPEFNSHSEGIKVEVVDK